MSRARALLAFLLLSASSAGAAAVSTATRSAPELFTWTDEKGVEHFGSAPPKITAGKKKLTTHKSLPVSTFVFKPAKEEPALAPARRETIVAAAVSPDPGFRAAPSVELYSTQSCPYCAQAREFLKENRIAFKEYDVEHDAAANQRFVNLLGRGVPLAVIGGGVISGFSPERYRQALGLR